MASGQGRGSEAERRRERLAAALRENLKRRKAVQRSRACEHRAGEPSESASASDKSQRI
jgi:hypothetical protein